MPYISDVAHMHLCLMACGREGNWANVFLTFIDWTIPRWSGMLKEKGSIIGLPNFFVMVYRIAGKILCSMFG